MKDSTKNKVATPAPKPKRKYQKESLLPTSPGLQEVKAGQPTSKEVKIQDSAPTKVPDLRESVFEFLQTGKSKADVLAEAIKLNLQNGSSTSNDELYNLVDELAATLDTEMSDEALLFKLIEPVILFHDDLSDPYFFCEGVPYKAPSRFIEARISHLFYKIKGYLPSCRDVRKVFDIMESNARFESSKVKLFNRVARKDSHYYFDLCNGHFVNITEKKWEIVEPFPLFRRFKHQQSQVEPVRGGNVWDIFEFLTIPKEDQLLILVYIISLFIAGIAHPILAVCGDQGSAKSFLCALINRLLDPTLTERIIQPKNERDLIQTFRQKYVTVLDNLSKIDQRVSDILCQVCTGGGVSYRQLYTDEGENIAQLRHVVILNSIRLPIVNADLMDRSIICKLHRISPEKRKPEQDLWREFDRSLPGILGGIFDTIVKSMAIYPTVKIDKLPRLADFAKWGYAIAEALGTSGDQFLKDFAANVKNQNESVVEKNVLCQAIMGLVYGKSNIEGSVADIHKDLKRIVAEDAKDESFPKLPHNLRGQLDLLRSTLLEHGITYQYFDRTKTGVRILISNSAAEKQITAEKGTNTSKPASPASPATPDQRPKPAILLTGVPDVPDVPDVAEFDLETFDFDGEVVNA